jgi:electron transport complex protein RnfE
MAKSIASEFTKGLWKEVPPFRLVLGLCPVLGVTTSMKNGIGMGLATTFVLLCSNVLVSLLRKVIPAKVRIACYIIIIATFVIVVEQMMAAFAYGLFLDLGVFHPVDRGQLHRIGPRRGVRLEKRCRQVDRRRVGDRSRVHLGVGLAGAVRELIGTGSLKGDVFGLIHWDFANIFGAAFEPFGFAVQAPGAFVILGLLLCAMNLIPSK